MMRNKQQGRMRYTDIRIGRFVIAGQIRPLLASEVFVIVFSCFAAGALRTLRGAFFCFLSWRLGVFAREWA